MKKQYLWMAAAATMLAACSQTDLVNEIPERAPKAIEFEGAFINNTTRSENNEAQYTNTFSDFHQDFAVWGYKKIVDNYIQVFNDKEVEVTKSENGEAYTYDGLVAWDNAASEYHFYAAAPSSHNWTFVEKVDDTFNPYFKTSVNLAGTPVNKNKAVHELVLNEPGDSKDLLIAAPTTPIKFQDVQLNFIHIMSRLNIRVQRPQDLTRDMYIYEVSVKNLHVAGDFDESKASANPSGSYERWTQTGDRDKITYTSSFTDETDGYLTVAKGADRNVMQTLIVPQPAKVEEIAVDGSDASTCNEPYLIIKYGLQNESVPGGIEKFKQYYNLAKAFGITSGELPFNEGWENTLTITVNSKAIGFTSKVSSWSTHNGTQTLQ